MKLKGKSYFIKTFGCQMNINDSERIAGFLESQKIRPAQNMDDANLVILNTCGVRQMAEDRVYGQVHNLTRNTKHETRNKIIIITGCLANRKDVKRRLKNKVDLFCEIKDFPDCFSQLLFTSYQLPNNQRTKRPKDYLSILPKHTSLHQAFVPIMTGCNNFCAYCVVPYARGREISRPPEEILTEIKNLIKNEYKEIILLGQNVNSYSYVTPSTPPTSRQAKQETTFNFPKLLKLIEKIQGKFWLSFVSSHPKDYSDDLIEVIARSKKIRECIHLPLQSGNNEILRKMNRNYTAEHYLKLIKKIKSAFKKHKPKTIYSLTTDIIVGFPSETRKQFLESANVMKKANYDMVYFGQFSPRPGTAAFQMKDNVSKKEKARREKFLNEILKKTALTNNKKYVGKKIEVLIDKKNNSFYFGRTRTGKNIKISSVKKNLIGKILQVKITKANEWNLEGAIE